MGKVTKRDVGRSIAIGAVVLLTLVFYGCAMGLHGETIVEWWIPAAVAVAMALVSGAVFWKKWIWLTRVENALLNGLCHVVFATGLFLCIFYAVNYAFADKDTEHTEYVTVESKYTKTRHRSRRIGRNRYAQGEAYKVYYIGVGLPDGRIKEMSATLKEYNRVRRGDTLAFPVERGFFGVPVIKRRGSKTEVPPSGYRRQFPVR